MFLLDGELDAATVAPGRSQPEGATSRPGRYVLPNGIEVVGEAADGAEAVELTRTVATAVVLLDVPMPVMDGLQALPAILASLARPRVLMRLAGAPIVGLAVNPASTARGRGPRRGSPGGSGRPPSAQGVTDGDFLTPVGAGVRSAHGSLPSGAIPKRCRCLDGGMPTRLG